jgi:hypothetical protein
MGRGKKEKEVSAPPNVFEIFSILGIQISESRMEGEPTMGICYT